MRKQNFLRSFNNVQLLGHIANETTNLPAKMGNSCFHLTNNSYLYQSKPYKISSSSMLIVKYK